MNDPTVDDLRVKLCYICREEERHDSRPDPPPVWTHPCKCTLVAHESCLIHWISTQERDFGRSRGELKCPQCGEYYEFEGYNPLLLRILNSMNRALSRSGRIIVGVCAGTVIISFGAGVYLTCATYGAFAVREFLGPDMFRVLLTANPTRWPWHAWINLPLIPFSLIAARTPIVLWTTSPLVPLLFPWPTTAPVAPHVARGGLRIVRSTRLPMWPPPPALVCALFPVVRALYQHLRARVTRALVQDQFPSRPQQAGQQRQQQDQQQQQQQQGQQRLRQLMERVRHGELRRRGRGDQQNGPQREQRQQQQQQPAPPQRQPQDLPEQEQQRRQRQQPAPPGGHRFQFQVGDQFALEITHIVIDRDAPAAEAPGPAPGEGAVDNNNPMGQQPQRPAEDQGPPADPEPQQQDIPEPQQPQQLEEQPEQQEQPQPQLQQPQPQPQPQPQQQGQRQEQGQGQRQDPQQPGADEDDFGAVAARAIRVTGASLGRLIGGALAMPTIARVMGAMLLHLSHVVPLIRAIIAVPRLPTLPPPPPTPAFSLGAAVSGLVGIWGSAGAGATTARPAAVSVFGTGIGAKVLSGFLATSHEWATSDPVWWRNALGLGVFLVVKDGLKILHLRLAKRELEERHIKNKSFSGVDLAGLDLVERDNVAA